MGYKEVCLTPRLIMAFSFQGYSGVPLAKRWFIKSVVGLRILFLVYNIHVYLLRLNSQSLSFRVQVCAQLYDLLFFLFLFFQFMHFSARCKSSLTGAFLKTLGNPLKNIIAIFIN